ncbi:hypothetical protein BKA82DRAFT_9216 [Pisolithus tinctorius]|uniref:Uncharacterized protein n=1 Tax=Pisolithus tinctorius Marx 270 TaxID=870435 RepID=A0A0C3K473_PISTI|nr:hypothetical protein BKA82DRAFT_9216 [Pisolithus tinctorius]KIO04342.1 hypothetical protein M404DRAFT_9216 [Pisolithus tinctorius Marx 270]
MSPFTSAAFFFPMGMDPFMDFEQVLWDGIQNEFPDPLEEPDEDSTAYTQNEKDYHIALYQNFISHIDNGSELVSGFEHERDSLSTFIDELVASAARSQTNDTGSLKWDMLTYMLEDPTTQSVKPPIQKGDPKSTHGWNHPLTARNLCPIVHLEEFDRNPHAYDQTIHEPACLYNVKMFDPNNTKKGFLRSQGLVQTFRHIFTSPSSALDPTRRGTKTPQGVAHGLPDPTPRTIAYAAIQYYFALSSTEQWTSAIGGVDLYELFLKIVKVLEDQPDHPWTQEMLHWWNKCLASAKLPSEGDQSQQQTRMTHQRMMTWTLSLTPQLWVTNLVVLKNMCGTQLTVTMGLRYSATQEQQCQDPTKLGR